MPNWKLIQTLPPMELANARTLCHHGVQFVTLAARANLPEAPDDSHSNMGWDTSLRALVSRDLAIASPGDTAPPRAGLRLMDLRLLLLRGEEILDFFPLDGHANDAAARWLDAKLLALGLKGTASVELPYGDIADDGVSRGESYSVAGQTAALATLAAWFGLADEVLRDLRSDLGPKFPDASPVRCWPHHFDIATLITLAPGREKETRTIGVGLSPGDGSFSQPYFYVSPWPTPGETPHVPLPIGHWHSDGFTAAVATGDEIIQASHPEKCLKKFLRDAVEAWDALLA